MREYAKIYYIYRAPVAKLLRLIVFGILLTAIFAAFRDSYTPSAIIGLLIFFTMWEVFFFFKVCRIRPKISAESNNDNVYDSFTLEALSAYAASNTAYSVIKKILRSPNVAFILKKANIEPKEIKSINTTKDEIAKLALKLAKINNGLFITTTDIFGAYILYTEPQTKLLFSKEIKEAEFIHILYWARARYKSEEQKRPIRAEFLEQGIGEDWVYGWTLETKKYTVDITNQALKEKPILIGRNKEYKEIIEALLDKTKNSVLLVGDPGSGKTTIIKYLALKSFTGKIEGPLKHKRILELMVSVLLSGVASQGELQERLTSIMQEISHAGNVMLYISKLEDILGSSGLNLDLSSVIIPYIKEGDITIVTATTPSGYKTHIEPLRDFVEFFDVIKLDEPETDLAIQMLMEEASLVENSYKLSITYKAIKASVEYANRYLRDTSLPGSAVTLLDETANGAGLNRKKIVDKEDIIAKVEETTKVRIGQPNREEKDLLLSFEDKMHEKIVDQEEAVSSIATALRRLRSGVEKQDKPISFLFLGPTGVGKTETAKILANLYFGGEGSMIRLDMSEYKTQSSVERMIDGELTQAIYEYPASLVLLDEFEKANPDILDLFLQILDDGRLTNGAGKTVSFADAIIIATSNAGSELIREELKNGQGANANFPSKLLDYLEKKGIFKPELLNRFDSIITFKPLGINEIYAITGLLLTKVKQKLKEEDIDISFDEKIKEKIAIEGFNEEFGARPLRRYIQDKIENALAEKILSSQILRGNSISVSTDKNNNISFSINQPR